MTGDDPAFETEEWAGESSRVQAVVDCFGPTDLVRMMEEQFADVPMEQKKLLFALGGASTEEGCPRAPPRHQPHPLCRTG